LALPVADDRLVDPLPQAAAKGWRDVELKFSKQTAPVIPDGAAEAGRWLRGHSDPDDLLATNLHCQPRRDACHNLHFWVAAYTERRVLVEGWGYTPTANEHALEAGIPQSAVEFWDKQRLADNDAAFTSPSEQTIGLLRDKYGVRWLFVDRRDAYPLPPPSPAIGEHAVLRFTAGDCAVYEVPGSPR
jgi:hypothetical protein